MNPMPELSIEERSDRLDVAVAVAGVSSPARPPRR
jgi:hypothetical protein